MEAKAGTPASVAFRELIILPDGRTNTSLWSSERVCHSQLGRLHLQAVEAILSPSISSADIMSAVAYGVTSQGLRVTQRDDVAGRIVAQRIEAPYLSSSNGRSSRPGAEKVEWRVVVVTLGVSKGLASWGGVERLLLLDFMTDPSPAANQDLVARSTAAVQSWTEKLGTGLSAATAGMGYPSSTSSVTVGGIMGATAGKSTSAVAIARQRSNQRAEALVEGVAGELNQLGCAGDLEEESMMAPLVGNKEQTSVNVVSWGGEDNNGEHSLSSSEVTASADDGTHDAQATLTSRERGCAVIEVRLCLQFVERLCARAMEFSRRDALETWRPLEETVHQLERVNGLLGQLLEPKYRALGASPPLVPKWSNRRGLSASATARPPLADGASGTQSGSGEGGKRITALLQPSGLFVVEGLVVKARAALSAGGASALEERSAASDTTEPANAPPEVVSSASEGHLAASVSVAQLPTAEEAKCVAARAVVKTLADVVGGVCEAREEALLKDCMPGAHKYVAELEAYRSMIVGGGALRAVAPTSPHGGEARARSEQVKSDGSSAEIDDDLWRLFGAMETRLYSSPAALGRKPGRIYLTCTTLWFHSKVMSFESRHVLPLSEVKSVTLLGTALDISSSLVIATKSGGEIMLVFPGQRATTLEPVELLIRELVQFIEAQEAAK